MHAGTAGKKQKLMHFIQKLKKGAIRDAAHYKGKGVGSQPQKTSAVINR